MRAAAAAAGLALLPLHQRDRQQFAAHATHRTSGFVLQLLRCLLPEPRPPAAAAAVATAASSAAQQQQEHVLGLI